MFENYIHPNSVKYADTKCEIEATVLDLPTISSSGNSSLLIETNKINNDDVKIKMRLYTPFEVACEPYDKISFTSYPFVLGDNNESSYMYFLSKKTYLGAYTKYDVFVERPNGKPLISKFPINKMRSEKILREYLDEDFAEFAISILFGDRAALSDELYSDFKAAGITHIMAVSGLHMSIWVYGLYVLMKKFRLKDKSSSIAAIMFSFCVMCFSSFSVSVVRAFIMTGVFFSGNLFSRKGDALNSLGLAGFIICVFNPFAVYDVSFLLSFFATLGIIVSLSFKPRFMRNYDIDPKSKLKKYITEITYISLAANLFVFPLTTAFFSSFSTLSFLSNILISFAVPICMVLAGLITAFPSVKFISIPLSFILKLFERYIFTVVHLIAKIPFSYIETANVFITKCLPCFLIVTVLVLYYLKKKKFSFVPILPALSLALICALS